MKKVFICLAWFCLPFLLTDLCWLLTFGAFNLRSEFVSSAFWTFTAFYWIFGGAWIPACIVYDLFD
jgi:hypothetical protein